MVLENRTKLLASVLKSARDGRGRQRRVVATERRRECKYEPTANYLCPTHHRYANSSLGAGSFMQFEVLEISLF